MRFSFVVPFAVFLSACSPPAPRSPNMRRLAAEIPPELGALNPTGPMETNWCYEVGNAPARIYPRCEPSRDRCAAKLAEARQGGLSEGFGNPFSECRPMRKEDIQRPRLLSVQPFVLPAKAKEASAQGAIVAECWVTVVGNAEDCHIVVSNPVLDQYLLDSLVTARFEPMRFVGRPLRAKYKIPMRTESR